MLPSRQAQNKDDLATLVEMGYTVDQATHGLQIDGTIESAIEWISNKNNPNDDVRELLDGEASVDIENAVTSQVPTAIVRPAHTMDTTQQQRQQQQQQQQQQPPNDVVENTETIFLEQRILQASLRGASERQDDDGDPVVICHPQDERSMSSLEASTEDSIRRNTKLSPDVTLSMTPTAHKTSAQYLSPHQLQARNEREKMKQYQQQEAKSLPRRNKSRRDKDDESYIEGSSSFARSQSTSSGGPRRRRSSLKTWIIVLAVVVLVLVGGGVTIAILLTSDDENTTGKSVDDRFSIFRSKLEYLSDDKSLFDDQSSPQYKALAWIANEDSIDLNIANQARFETRYALAVLYFATSGTHWLDQKSFLSPLHECSWTNTSGFQGTHGGVACDSAFRVTGITLARNNLQGTIPMELGALSNLEALILRDNVLEGTMPKSLGKLIRLSTLDLGGNTLTSGLPQGITNLKELKTLILDNNQFTGAFITTVSSLTKLRELNVTQNLFEGDLFSYQALWPFLGHLELLDISQCRFTGRIQAVENLRDLSVFRFDGNTFTGMLPEKLRNLRSLSILSGSRNKFSGRFPWEFLTLANNLTSVEMSYNLFTGALPDPSDIDSSSFASTLSKVDFSNNRVSTIPDSVGSLTSLKQLVLSQNQIMGPLPTTLGKLVSLEILDVSNNSIDGLLPSELGECRNLEELELHSNQISGTVPMEYEQLASLERFSVHDNDLAGDISFLCSAVPALDSLDAMSADCSNSSAKVVCSCCQCV